MKSTIEAVRVRWVFPVSAPPQEDAVVEVSGGSVVNIRRASPRETARDLDNVAILPGLVNAHTHLEFSDLTEPIGQPGMSLPDWIRAVVARRRDCSDVEHRKAMELGVAESVATGVACIGEITTRSALPTGVDSVCFREAIGLSTERSEMAVQAIADWFAVTADVSGEAYRRVFGMSPHAPYSVSPQLLDAMIQQSLADASGYDGRCVPFAMHLAETREELELLATGGGPFRDLLDELGAWDANVFRQSRTPADLLTSLARTSRALVVHGNYLTESEITFCGNARDRLSIVYCPRTHQYFGHKPYPLTQMLAADVRVCVGTDSRASNPDLNLWNELQTIAAQHPSVPFEQILRMGTIDGATALGVDDQHGVIAAGRPAHLTLVSLPEQTLPPHELLFQSGHDYRPRPLISKQTRRSSPRT